MPPLSPRAKAANSLLKRKLEERCTNLTAAFRKVDKSNNGFITPADFSEVMASFGIRVTRPSLMAIVAKYDANGDGFVSYEEFCATMAGASNPGLAAAPKIAAPAATSRAEEATRRTIICAAYAPYLYWRVCAALHLHPCMQTLFAQLLHYMHMLHMHMHMHMHGECTVRCMHCACSIAGRRIAACRTSFDTLRT